MRMSPARGAGIGVAVGVAVGEGVSETGTGPVPDREVGVTVGGGLVVDTAVGEGVAVKGAVAVAGVLPATTLSMVGGSGVFPELLSLPVSEIPAQADNATRATRATTHPQTGTLRFALPVFVARGGALLAGDGIEAGGVVIGARYVASLVIGAMTVPRAAGGDLTASNCSNPAALLIRWLIEGAIAAMMAAEVLSLRAGLAWRGGRRVSMPLTKSGASGGTNPVSSV